MERKWWLVIVGCITHAVNTGLSYFGMSAYFPSIEREFGWSRTAISGAFSLARIESGLLGPIEGFIVDRVGARRIMYIGIIRTGPGISGALVPFIGWMIVSWGWRNAAIASGVILLSLGLPLAVFIN